MPTTPTGALGSRGLSLVVAWNSLGIEAGMLTRPVTEPLMYEPIRAEPVADLVQEPGVLVGKRRRRRRSSGRAGRRGRPRRCTRGDGRVCCCPPRT